MEIQRRLQLRPSIAANAALQPFVHLPSGGGTWILTSFFEPCELLYLPDKGVFVVSQIRGWLVVS